MAEIIQELPRLTRVQRAIIMRLVRELDGPDETLFLHEAAVAMFREMDQPEETDACLKTG